MKKIFFSLALSTVPFLSGMAAAHAEESVRTSWRDGLYIGAVVGRSNTSFHVLDGPNNSHAWWGDNDYGSNDTQGLSKALQVGYNHRIGPVVAGLEAELGTSLLNISTKDPVNNGPTAHASDKLHASAALRVGYPFGKALLYAKGGWSYMLAQIDWQDPVYTSYTTDIRPLNAGVYGGGLEYSATEAISLKAEYLRYEFNDTNVLDLPWPCCTLYRDPFVINPIDSFRLGLTLRLNED